MTESRGPAPPRGSPTWSDEKVIHSSRAAAALYRERARCRLAGWGQQVLAVVDCDIPAATSGPPVHVHPTSDETFVVLSGALLVYREGDVAELGPGDVVHISRGTRHTFAATPSGPARFLTLHTPGGFEQFHVAAAAAERTHGVPLSRDELMHIAADYDWQPAGPPLLPTGVLAGQQ